MASSDRLRWTMAVPSGRLAVLEGEKAQGGGAMIRPWYRSRLLVGGVLLLGLLLWLWVDSVCSRTICTLESNRDAVVFALRDGRIYFGLIVNDPYLSEISGADGSGTERTTAEAEARRWIVPPLDFKRSRSGDEGELTGMTQIWIGLWAIVLGYLLLWIAGQVIWLQRRKRQLSTPTIPSRVAAFDDSRGF